MFKTLKSNLKFPKCFRKKKFHISIHHFQDSSLRKIVQGNLEEKIVFWYRKYEDLFGLTKLSEMHERVTHAQKSVHNVQERRKNIQEKVFVAQNKLAEMQDILSKTSMGNNMYISIVTQVHELLKEQNRLEEAYKLCDIEEKEQQIALALAINNSQDHERTYREKTKYISVVAGIVGAILGLFASSTSSWLYRKDIKVMSDTTVNQFSVVDKKLNGLFAKISNMENISLHENYEKEIDNFISQIKVHQELFTQTLVSNTITSESDVIKELYFNLQNKRISELEESLSSKLNHHTLATIGTITSLLFVCSFVLYMINSR